MIDFKSCDKCKFKDTATTKEPCVHCIHAYSLYENYNPMTNADRIRNMTDEELAEFIVTVRAELCELWDFRIDTLEWLKSEAEDK